MGLILEVFRCSYGDCSAGGISSKYKEVTAINCEGPFDPAPDRPPVILESHVANCVRAVPVDTDGRPLRRPEHTGPMFGGCYVASSDSRFGEKVRALLGHKFYGAVALHDRYEGPAQRGD